MIMTKLYERKISTDEANEGYFLVLKNKLSFFPIVGTPFRIKAGTRNKKAIVESYRCTCQGPDEPHEHYYIRWPGLAKGDRVIVKRLSVLKPLYSVRIEE